MATSWSGWYWRLVGASLLAIGYAIADSFDCALAQITPDGTLGAESSVVTPLDPGSSVDAISGGATRGANLFHSFEQFSVLTGRAAFFNNALEIQNIISRVTGGSLSFIDGKLQANGTANLFLLNPKGIIFGPNATLAIGGSILASTASAINFADGTQFSAQAHPTTPLLTVSVPLGLQFGGETAGSIQNQSQATDSSGQIVGLQVQPGKTLALVGGDVRMEGGNLQAPGGFVELGGVSSSGTVGLNVDGNNLRLSFADGVDRADVSLTNAAEVKVSASGGGSIAINAQNLNIAGGSRLQAGIAEGLGFIGSVAGDIEIKATEAVNLTNDSVIANEVPLGAVGNGGGINITTGSLSVMNDAQLNANTFGQGNAGSVTIHAGSTVSFDGVGSNGSSNSGVVSRVESSGNGNGGNIDITSESVFVRNGALLVASTLGRGNAGNVKITADEVSFDGVGSNQTSSGAFSIVRAGAEGKGGSINITTGSLSLRNGAFLSVITNGQGDAGSVTINAHDTVSFDGVGSNGRQSGAFSRVEERAVGNGGNIDITAESLSVTNGALLVASTLGRGNGGNVTITADDTVSFNGVGTNGGSSGVSSRVVPPKAEGNGGSINITTGSLFVSDGAFLNASTSGNGNAGSVTILARDTVSFDGVGSKEGFSRALSSVQSGAVGNGGGINITTGSLSVTNNAQLIASSEGSGAAGNIEVAAGSILLDNQAKLTAETASGNGGDIRLEVQDLLLLRRDSQISTTAGIAGAGGDGGNITINNTPFIVAVPSENSDITANAFEGKGGFIQITAQAVFGIEPREQLTPLSDITASSGLGSQFSGTVQINTPDVDPSLGLVALPAELVDVTGLIAQSCPAGVRQAQSEFIVTGRGGLPPSPSDPLSSDTVWSDLRYRTQLPENLPSSSSATQQTFPTTQQLVEATGWVINNQGEVVLTATAVPVLPHIPWIPPAQCHAPESAS